MYKYIHIHICNGNICMYVYMCVCTYMHFQKLLSDVYFLNIYFRNSILIFLLLYLLCLSIPSPTISEKAAVGFDSFSHEIAHTPFSQRHIKMNICWDFVSGTINTSQKFMKP